MFILDDTVNVKMILFIMVLNLRLFILGVEIRKVNARLTLKVQASLFQF